MKDKKVREIAAIKDGGFDPLLYPLVKASCWWWWFSRHLWRWCQTESSIPKENLPFSSLTKLHAFWLSGPLRQHSSRWWVVVWMVSSEEGILPLSLRQHRYFDLLWRRKSPSLNVLRESPGPKQMGFFDFLISILLWENAICKEWFLTEKQVAKEIAWLWNKTMKLKMVDNCNF